MEPDADSSGAIDSRKVMEQFSKKIMVDVSMLWSEVFTIPCNSGEI